MNINYTTAKTTEELLQILSLQQINLKSAVTSSEIEQEGFVTVSHNLDLLKNMNEACPHIIAKDDDKVVGYALSMVPSFKNEITVLQPMFQELDRLHIQNYLVMGQICISKNHRKQGIFRGLYEVMKKASYPTYESIITEVDATNTRSLGAHYSVGFENICTYDSLNQDWKLISLRTS
ncbi:GNAT family N-acetyltransferase [Maribacter sp. ACAM166]|uniref:GNAT family N-acetyltransferase n=1 Tax=Maribacter sp. ACAM166 TaxID=2508996 RepID=UPI0010FD33CB|nr:GNAT family N-acetyltransferase [Maribacter sp. ACAM166]TLP72907.1 GNAT family N-acetyltransferase [Maribacter sp. ACAM166]